jgi:hypothetical protein
MAMHASAARARLGALLGGAEGSLVEKSAEGAIAAEGVRNVPRWLAIYLPGKWGAVAE